MDKYNKISLFGGWGVFLFALICYTMTLEPTTSLWDAGEFIATSYKLEVGHPPGTPLFFLINRFGAMFAGEPENVAYAINFMSGLESALTIAFMFWSIVMLGRMMFKRHTKILTPFHQWSVIIGAAIGSLSYAFTDTFWFSAVEAEVYALSSLFTAAVFWAILKWETVADQEDSNRWLIFIAYLMGLSIGAHILNLLAIPALVLVYYFKKYPNRNKKDLWKPLAVAVLLTGVFYKLTPTVVSIGGSLDRLFVNSFGFAANSGLATLIILLIAATAYGAYWAHKNNHPAFNTIFISIMMIVLGFSSYGIVLIRSAANPPMNSNHPDDPYKLLSVLNREQYGSHPLFKGQTYKSKVTDYKYKTTYYMDQDGQYKESKKLDGYVYDKANMLLPRMHSQNGSHIEEYKKWGNVNHNGVPTMGENLGFFFSYQLNHMYWRYFLWNFVGRQSDIQSTGNIDNGGWMSGITPIDEMMLGPQTNLPDEIANNKGRNHYYFLPLILALIGLFFHLKHDGRGCLIVMLLFFMTGIAIILYLNQTPLQVRERDYAYAGSFYAFAMWIGFGAMAIAEFLNKKLKNKRNVALVGAAVMSASVPTILLAQNWDDHDRSGRTIARDFGVNYLNSILPNGILINYGDNDTFPVWYAQEVEGVRPDVKLMNSSYINSGWYTEQMKDKTNEADPLPIKFPTSKYIASDELQFPVYELPHPRGGQWTVQEVMEIVNSDNDATKIQSQDGTKFDFVPARRMLLPVNKENAIKAGILKAEDAHLAADTIEIVLKDDMLHLSDIIFLDILANFDWKRPLQFTSYSDMFKFGLVSVSGSGGYSYLQNMGATYMLTPIKNNITDFFTTVARVDSDILYDNLINKFNWGNVENEDVYVDTFADHLFAVNRIRESFAALANQLTLEGDTIKAVEVLDTCLKRIPPKQIRYNESMLALINAYWKAGEFEKGNKLANDYGDNLMQYLDYYEQFVGRKADLMQQNNVEAFTELYTLYSNAAEMGSNEIVERYHPFFEEYNS